jgi:hypothetical protein
LEIWFFHAGWIGKFVGRQRWKVGNLRSAFSAFEFASIREIRVKKFLRGSCGSRLEKVASASEGRSLQAATDVFFNLILRMAT